MSETSKTTALPPSHQTSLNNLMIDGIGAQRKDLLELCLRKGAIPASMTVASTIKETKNSRPLAHYAYEYYNSEIFTMLIQAGMHVDAKDSSGDTVLLRMVRAANLDGARDLIKNGASVLEENKEGITVLAAARVLSSSNRDQIVTLLLEALPDVKDRAKKDDFNMNAGPITLDKAIPPVKPLTFKPPPGNEP